MDNKELLEVIELIKPSFDWMLDSIRHVADDLDEGNYSIELQAAICVQELLEVICEIQRL